MANPQKRRIGVNIFTDAGWIMGTLHIPIKGRLLEHLNHTREFVALTDVRFESKPDPIPFFALQRDSAILVFSTTNEPVHNLTVEETTVHRLSCLLGQGTLYGNFKTLRGVRVSDYMSALHGFFLLEEVDLWLTDRWGRAVTEEHRPHVLVNVQHLIGVTEDPSPSAPSGA